MSTRTDRKNRMAAAAASRTDPEAAPAGQTAIRTKDARITLNLPPQLYRQLTRWADSAAEDLGLPRVGVQNAMRAMIVVITSGEDPDASARVQAVLWEELGR